ncbi:hypothetical protein HPHPH10_0192 [Helicobacter pylori Hp H-10]|nr:hypothetical protein HPHPH10_0192 [Helicobacter pylori Hp H-10]
MGGMILLPYPLTRFTRFRRFTHRRCVPIKTIASALILCKNYCYEYFLVEGFQ